MSTTFPSDVADLNVSWCGSTAAEALSKEACMSLVIIRNFVACLSLAGCIFILSLSLLHKTYRDNWAQRLVLWMTVSALLQPIPYLFGSYTKDKSHCQAQAFFVTWLNWALMLWVVSVSTSIFWAVIYKASTEKHEIKYHAVCWGVGFFVALIPIFVDAYDHGGLWCWIGKSHTTLRFTLWYGPLFLAIVILLIGNTYVLRKVRQDAKAWQGTYHPSIEKEKEWMHSQIQSIKYYPLLYLFVSIFPMINRIQNAIEPNNPIVGLYVLQAIFAPAQGLINAVYYITTVRHGWDQCTFEGIRRSFLIRGTRIAEYNMSTGDDAHNTSNHSELLIDNDDDFDDYDEEDDEEFTMRFNRH
eukprot:m.56950 g.56950  ORF g.56950 m.56950 type:complete len:356 (-) comp22321_c0_seq1:17-1084(-)